MRRISALWMLLALAGPAFGQRLVADRPDHVILVTIESKTADAVLWPATTNEDAEAVAELPFVVPVQFTWDTGWVNKKWDRLDVRAPGGLAKAKYDKKSKRWTVTLAAEVRAPGHAPLQIERQLASFTKPDDLDWDRIHFLPSRVTIPATLQPLSSEAGARAAGPRGPATVMLAGDQPGAAGRFGTVVLEASVPEAEVIVDGAPAGRTPVRLILREGKHDVTVQKPGYRANQQQLTVSADSEVRLAVTLDAAP